MKFITTVAFLAIATLLTGCAHPIKVNPDLSNTSSSSHLSKFSATVGYHIPSELLALEVTTPGGGGDNVRYFPYRDIDAGYERALSDVFSGVVKLTSTPDYSQASNKGLDYIIQPQIVTSSGSTAFFTWPPTNFTVDLTTSVRDSTGNLVASPRVVSVGTAGTSERLIDHGVAGKRAMKDALSKMQQAISELNLSAQLTSSRIVPIHSTSKPIRENTATPAVTRLTNLQELKNKGLLTNREYETKRKEILDAL